MKKTLYIIYSIVVIAMVLGLAGCMKNAADYNPPDKPDPITPPNPNSKHFILVDTSRVEHASTIVITDVEQYKQ